MFQNFYVSIFTKVPLFLKPFFGPSYYQCHGCDQILPHQYDASPVEALSKTFLDYELWALSLGKYYLPYYLLTRSGNIDPALLAKYSITYGSLLAATWFILGISRALNDDYTQFINKLALGERKKIAKFDFQMTHWPVDFQAGSTGSLTLDEKKKGWLVNPVYSFFGSTLGRTMIMPGSLGFIQNQMQPHFLNFRRKFEEQGAQRAKIQLDRSTFIDTTFFDNRQRSAKGRTLVICSEGNAAFYEVGIVTIPGREGYSVMGWNRPGFGESVGTTSPENERASIKGLLEYAREVLGFEDILLFGWSIGGYPTAVGANVKDSEGKPVVKGVILDATFDHITPMAGVVLPGWFQGIATGVVKQEWDLDVSAEMCKYKGNVLFFRRLRDEIISTGGPTRPDQNRINWLLYDVIQSRFPVVSQETMKKVEDYVNKGYSLRAEDDYERMIFKFVTDRFHDIPAGHNDQLPQARFRQGLHSAGF